MTTPGKTFLKSVETLPPRVLCICGGEECQLLSYCFQSLDNDIRGKFMLMPALGGTLLTDLKEHKIKRTLVHCNLYTPNKDEWKCSIDGRGKADKRSLRSDGEQPPPKRTSRRYIANHHFNPAILQMMLKQGMTNVDCITSELINELGLLENQEYTNDDLFPGTLSRKTKKSSKSILTMPGGTAEGPYYVPVPSYKGAKEDYKYLSDKWRMDTFIAECKLKCRERNSTLARQGEDDILRPVVKRPKLEVLPALDPDNNHDLQLAVCMLDDDVQAANAEIKRLKEELRMRDALWRDGIRYKEGEDYNVGASTNCSDNVTQSASI